MHSGWRRKCSGAAADEGQDLSPLQYDLLSSFVRPGHAAVFGDLRQSIHGYRGIRDWQVVIDALGTGQEQVEQLHLTFRSSQEITEQANRVLEATGSAQPRAQAVPRPGPPVHFVRYGREADLVPLLAHEVRRLQREGARNIGIITRSPEESQGLYERVKDRKAFPIDSRTRNFENYSGGIAVVPIGVAKGLEFDAAILIRADAATYSPGTPYDGPLLYTAVSRALHHLTIFAAEAFTPLLGEVPAAQPGPCPISGLEISPAGFHRPPPHLTGRARKAGQERGPGANHQEMVRTYDGRFDSTPSYEGDGSRENPWHDR
ncbi:ATP-binding domain-containing protein [Deinococcus sp. YIM 134068]|uniref:UvrD-helicase domain-containing protein n=1 Tax=Deinococcus lichenicola TaxID=3118910 RepID=UPI002F930158